MFAESLCAGGNQGSSISEILSTIDRYLYQKSLDPAVMSSNGPRATSAITEYTNTEWISESSDNLKSNNLKSNTSLHAESTLNVNSSNKSTDPPIKTSNAKSSIPRITHNNAPSNWRDFYAKQEKELKDTIKGLDSILNQRKEFSRRIEAESAADIITSILDD